MNPIVLTKVDGVAPWFVCIFTVVENIMYGFVLQAEGYNSLEHYL